MKVNSIVEINVLAILALFGVTIVVGYVGSVIFGKTRIADVVWLLIFGILIGPVFNLVDRNLFLTLSPFLAAIALLLILFDAGLDMNFYQIVRGAPRGFLMTVVVFIFSVAAAGAVVFYLLNFDILTALLLGAILGGTSSPTVISLVS